MIVLALVVVFLVTVLSGPAGVEWRERRQLELDRPAATVHYLPSAGCREGRDEQANRDARLAHRAAGCTTVFRCVWCDD